MQGEVGVPKVSLGHDPAGGEEVPGGKTYSMDSPAHRTWTQRNGLQSLTLLRYLVFVLHVVGLMIVSEMGQMGSSLGFGYPCALSG